MQRLIGDMKTERRKIRSITVTGHSLGGALAVLCADDISKQLRTQQQLDHVANQCANLLQQCQSALAVHSAVNAATTAMQRSLLFVQEASKEASDSSRISAAQAVDAAADAVGSLRKALSAKGCVKDVRSRVGYPNQQKAHVQELLNLLKQAQSSFTSKQLSSAAPTAAKLVKAALRCAAAAPPRGGGIGAALNLVRAWLPGHMQHQPAEPAGPEPAAVNDDAAQQPMPDQVSNTATQLERSTDGAAASPAHAFIFCIPQTLPASDLTEHALRGPGEAVHGDAASVPDPACNGGEAGLHNSAQQQQQQQQSDSDAAWKITLEAAATYCSAAAALAMVMAQLADPVPDIGRHPSFRPSRPSTAAVQREPAHDSSASSSTPHVTPDSEDAQRPSTQQRLQLDGNGSPRELFPPMEAGTGAIAANAVQDGLARSPNLQLKRVVTRWRQR